MLLSFRPDVYEKIKSGVKIFEHRRNFPNEPIIAYMYVSSPVKAITGVVYLGKRHCLSDWMEDYKEDGNAVTRIKEYIEKKGQPIYPDENLNEKENTAIMKEKNAEYWKQVYEEFYQTTLEYTTIDNKLGKNI